MPVMVVLTTEALWHRQPREKTNMAGNCDAKNIEDMEEEGEEE